MVHTWVQHTYSWTYKLLTNTGSLSIDQIINCLMYAGRLHMIQLGCCPLLSSPAIWEHGCDQELNVHSSVTGSYRSCIEAHSLPCKQNTLVMCHSKSAWQFPVMVILRDAEMDKAINHLCPSSTQQDLDKALTSPGTKQLAAIHVSWHPGNYVDSEGYVPLKYCIITRNRNHGKMEALSY